MGSEVAVCDTDLLLGAPRRPSFFLNRLSVPTHVSRRQPSSGHPIRYSKRRPHRPCLISLHKASLSDNYYVNTGEKSYWSVHSFLGGGSGDKGLYLDAGTTSHPHLRALFARTINKDFDLRMGGWLIRNSKNESCAFFTRQSVR